MWAIGRVCGVAGARAAAHSRDIRSIGRSLSEEELSELPECVLRERGVNYEYM